MSLFKSIATFGGFTLVSRITGFFRDMALANYLGAGLISDAFFVAFKLPNLFRSLFAEGAFTSAFVPMLSQKLVGENREDALFFASRAISILAFFLGIFVLIMELLMPWVVELLAPGFVDDHGKIELATSLSRITFPFLLFISVVSFQSGILNSLGKFAAPAAAPVILNLMMIISVFVFAPFGETPAHGIAFGVSFAGFMEIIWLTYFLHRENVYIRPQYNILELLKDNELRTLFKRIAPGVLGLPILSRHLKSGDKEQARLVQDKAVEYGTLLSIPAAVALIILAVPIINILFQHGKFGALETQMTAQAVIAYTLGLPFYVLVKAMTPNFFARGDTKTPVKYSIVVLLTNLCFSVILMKPFGHVGIASATTIAAVVSFCQYCRGLRKRRFWKYSKELRRKTFKIFLCSLLMGGMLEGAMLLLDRQFGNWLHLGIMPKLGLFGLLCILGVATFAITAKIFGVLDIAEILNMFCKRKKKHA